MVRLQGLPTFRRLVRGRLDPNWWRVVRTSDGVVVGGLLTYVDDFLLGGSKEVITALAKAIQEIWKTTPLTMATPDTPLRFLGVEILVQGSGFVLSQQAYAEELLRLNNVKPTALGKIPCPRDLACFALSWRMSPQQKRQYASHSV